MSKILEHLNFVYNMLKDSVNLQKNPRPLACNYAVTYACNSRCNTCNIWQVYSKNNDLKKRELRLDEIENLFSNSRELKNLRSVGVTGGEPFLRKDIVEICNIIALHCPKTSIHISTNGFVPNLIEKKIKDLLNIIDNSRLYVYVSLDGIGRTHDKSRGIKDSYDRAIETITRLKRTAIKTGVSFTITNENYNEIKIVYEIAKKLNANFGARCAQQSEAYYNNADKTFHFSTKELDHLDMDLGEIILDSSGWGLLKLGQYFQSKIVEFERLRTRIFPCYSGSFSFFMNPYGDIFPCAMLNKKIGNIRETNFDETWDSEKMRNIREFINSRKCFCWTDCEAIPSIGLNFNSCFIYSVASNFKRCLGIK